MHQLPRGLLFSNLNKSTPQRSEGARSSLEEGSHKLFALCGTGRTLSFHPPTLQLFHVSLFRAI